MAKKSTQQIQQEERENSALVSTSINNVFLGYKNFVDNLGSAKTTLAIISLLFSVGVCVFISLPFASHLPGWVQTLLTIPVGLLLTGVALGWVYSQETNSLIISFKHDRTRKQRFKLAIVFFIIGIFLTLALGQVTASGVGGALMITLCVCLIVFMLPTEEEIEYIKRGIPDPRDVTQDDEFDTNQEADRRN